MSQELIKQMEEKNWDKDYDGEVAKLVKVFNSINSGTEDYYYVHQFALKHTKPGDYILDVGCGVGMLCNLLKDNGRNPTGVDVSDEAVKQSSIFVPSVHFKKMYSERLEFQDELFDVVCSTEVLEHLVDPEVALAELYRVCKKGGKLIVSVQIRDLLDNKGKSKHLHNFDFYKLMFMFQDYGEDFKIYPINKFKHYDDEIAEPYKKLIYVVVFNKV